MTNESNHEAERIGRLSSLWAHYIYRIIHYSSTTMTTAANQQQTNNNKNVINNMTNVSADRAYNAFAAAF